MSSKHKIPFVLGVARPIERSDAYISHPVESYWVGIGTIGNKKRPEVRRLLRARDSMGICTYFIWTEPRKGTVIPVTHHFKRKKKITREQAKLHFTTNNKKKDKKYEF